MVGGWVSGRCLVSCGVNRDKGERWIGEVGRGVFEEEKRFK